MTVVFHPRDWTPVQYQKTLDELAAVPEKKPTPAHFSLADRGSAVT